MSLLTQEMIGMSLDEFASQIYRVGCTECNGTGFEGIACFNEFLKFVEIGPQTTYSLCILVSWCMIIISVCIAGL